jgi:hypothetical protein
LKDVRERESKASEAAVSQAHEGAAGGRGKGGGRRPKERARKAENIMPTGPSISCHRKNRAPARATAGACVAVVRRRRLKKGGGKAIQTNRGRGRELKANRGEHSCRFERTCTRDGGSLRCSCSTSSLWTASKHADRMCCLASSATETRSPHLAKGVKGVGREKEVSSMEAAMGWAFYQLLHVRGNFCDQPR